MLKYKITNINYDLSGEEMTDEELEEVRKNLPQELVIELWDDEDLTFWLAEEIASETGWLAYNFDYEKIDDYLLMSTNSVVDFNEPEDSTLGLLIYEGKFETISECIKTVKDLANKTVEDEIDNSGLDREEEVEEIEVLKEHWDNEIKTEDELEFDDRGQAYLGSLSCNTDDFTNETDYFIIRL